MSEMDELKSFEATRQGSPPTPNLFPERDEGEEVVARARTQGWGCRLTGAPGAGGWGRGP